MKFRRSLLATPALLLALSPLYGQETQNSADAKKSDQAHLEREHQGSNELTAGTPLRAQIVISEFDGTQKISSLPYSLNLLGTYVQSRKEAHLRLGVRVPIQAGNAASFTYQDVGTNIDATAYAREDEMYRLDLLVDRSSVLMSDKGTDWKPGESNPSTQPLIRSFRDEFTVVLKPGQTVEGSSAVDPATGHILKVEVTLNIAK